MKSKKYTGKNYSKTEINFANRLLRLELSLKRTFLNNYTFNDLKPTILSSLWSDYFGQMIGGAEIMSNHDLENSLFAIASTKGEAQRAFVLWQVMQQHGWQGSREFYSRATWFRSAKILKAAGLSDSDLSSGTIVPLRQKILECELATGWDFKSTNEG